LGSTQEHAYVSLEPQTDYLAITSDLCTHCDQQAYKPGKSKTATNSGHKFSLSDPNTDRKLKVFAFKDNMCFGYKQEEKESRCVKDMAFYAIYEEMGLPRGVDF